MDELGSVMGGWLVAGEERGKEMVALQRSVEQYTRVLVRLTIAVAIIGLAGIGATIWAAVR